MSIKTIITLLLAASLLAACGGSQPTATPVPRVEVQSTPLPPTAQPTTAVKVQPSLFPTSPYQDTTGGEERDLTESSDLDLLDSYRAAYSWKWSETKDGATKTGFWDALEEYSRADTARRTLWSGSDGSIEIIRVGPYAYMKGEDGKWTSMLSSNADPLGVSAMISDPLSLISGKRGKLVQRGMSVNGVAADHYKLEESSGGFMGFGVADKMNGDVYVSADLQVIVKYVAHYEGKQLGISGGSNGVLDVTFDLTDVNQPVQIAAPEGVAPPVAEDIPVMEGATELNAMGGVVSFKTTRSIAEVTAFYNQAMPLNGWQVGQSAMEGLLNFTKGKRQATIMLQAEGGLTTVTVIAAE